MLKKNFHKKKVDRLLELYFKYAEEVDEIDKSIAEQEDEEDDEQEIENYLLRLENGLFALQSIVYIIMEISVNGSSTVRKLIK